MQWLVKIWVRLALLLYCKKIYISRKEDHSKKLPTILACNHPNSFLDALIIGSYYPKEIYFLARGDAFKKPFVAKILRALNMIPVYRISEGKDNLEHNTDSFKQCIEVLKQNKTLLIFSEGICINEWKLRTLKKGTARIAYQAWFLEGLPALKIVPTGISYNSFTSVPKTAWINENDFLSKEDFTEEETARFYNQFNKVLEEKLKPLILTKEETIISKERNYNLKILLLALPSFIGWLTQKWFYNYFKNIAQKKTINTVFYDSVLFGLLLITYPILVLIICIIGSFFSAWSWSLILLLPFTAWCYKEYKSL